MLPAGAPRLDKSGRVANDQPQCGSFRQLLPNERIVVKENEISGRKELESIDSEMFHSFDPEDASWITGGKIIISRISTGENDNTLDILEDVQFN